MSNPETVALLRAGARALDYDPILEFSPEGREAIVRFASVIARCLRSCLNAEGMRTQRSERNPDGYPVARRDREILDRCVLSQATRAEIHRLQDLIYETTAGVPCAELDPALSPRWLAPAPLLNKYRALAAQERLQ